MTASDLGTHELHPQWELPVIVKGSDRIVNTFNFTACDPSSGYGLVLGMNSLPRDPTMWRHGVMLFHPSGDVLLGKGYGRGSDDRGPGTGNLKYSCDEPYRRWMLSFDGFVQRVDPQSIRDALLQNDEDTPLRFELVYEAVMPAWGHATDGEVAGTHYEQNGMVRGWIDYDGERTPFDGVGFRDRLLGPKDTSRMSGHAWINGTFGDGRAFALTVVSLSEPDAPSLSSACMLVDGDVLTAEVLDVPMWDDIDEDPGPLTIRLQTPAGETTILAEPRQWFPLMYVSSPSVGLQSALFGQDRSRRDALLIWESTARFRWDGAIGYGHVERSHKIR